MLSFGKSTIGHLGLTSETWGTLLSFDDWAGYASRDDIFWSRLFWIVCCLGYLVAI